MTPEAPAKATASNATEAPIIVDLGKRRRKLVRRLRKGTGKLMDEVQAAIDEIRRAGRISGNVQPIIVVVSPKTKSGKFGFPMFG